MNISRYGHFLTTYPPHLVHLVFERPLNEKSATHAFLPQQIKIWPCTIILFCIKGFDWTFVESTFKHIQPLLLFLGSEHDQSDGLQDYLTDFLNIKYLVLIFCVEFWELSHLTHNLSQAEKKKSVVTSWATDKITTIFTQNGNFSVK